ncbi:CocE/NonD family hydrolase [Lutibacter sp. TH_r2]|uniref:CocE/NonD family hydrolase n=1 Tax=Lutibacter sp. TH_r2 TaxID=3082083 RepID=UPI002952E816|nr:CocE/NonD family hydrolase [Lutibacter sp. TH_r2]MDV7186001.1 CocE/NonD family hydrolase [Lutibacter sp. TH_r2]
MKIQVFKGIFLLLIGITLFSCKKTTSFDALKEVNYVEENYTKTEAYITMRDSVKLFTVIYSPKNTSKKYPILLQRTPYSCRPYGEDKFKNNIAPNPHLMKEGNIIVYQDVRGRWMSEGTYDNMRAYIPNKKSNLDIDESSDTYDTIDWLVKNVENNNGNVGTWGISYPGFYSTYSTIDAHPALKAASPQACIGDFYFDDFHHNGAYMLAYFKITSLFGTPKTKPSNTSWYKFPDLKTKDGYQFFLDAGPLKNLDTYFEYEHLDTPNLQSKNKATDFFWEELKEHPNYDEVWQSKGLIQHLKNVKSHVATMVVGGLFDAEDLYGPLETYKNIEEFNKNNYNTLVFGPWSHGQWVSPKSKNNVGNYYFGDSISLKYQTEIETKFFNHFLKGNGDKNAGLPEAYVYDTGKKEWNSYNNWPPKKAEKKVFYLSENQKLTTSKEKETGIKFISDINKPVPFSEDIKTTFTPRKYMTDDQRFAARRNDVLIFETEVLENDLTLVGDILAKLQVATTGTDADWVVKVIDVHPSNIKENNKDMQKHLKLSNYHLMVRSEIMRGKFRNSFTHPEPFVPNKKTAVNIKLQDIHHTFKKGHKLQIQVQSTWFPLFDLNPQTYVDNIFKADKKDFKTQTHTVFTSSEIEFKVLN